MGITLHPGQLALVRVEDFHPQFGTIGMRRISADRLDIHAGDGRGGIENGGGRIPFPSIYIAKSIIVPE
jgi:hypothetical protein